MGELEPELKSPVIVIETTEGDMVLHWFNTRIRTFRDKGLNHIEWRDDENVLKGIRVTQQLMDILFEHEFPYQFDPVVDDATREWFIQSEAKLLDSELNEL